MECRMGEVDVDIRISSHLKEELAWAADKQLWVISTTMLFKNICSTKRNQRIKLFLNLKQYCLHCYVALSNVF